MSLLHREGHRQGVHIRAQADRAAWLRAFQRADEAGLAKTAGDLNTPALQLVRHQLRGADLLERQFRVGVDILAPFGHFVLHGGDGIDDGHGGLPGRMVANSARRTLGRLEASVKRELTDLAFANTEGSLTSYTNAKTFTGFR